MRYRLGTIDHGFVPRKLTVCYAAICVGEVDAELLERAFGLLCRKYPMLGGHIEVVEGECFLHLPDNGASTSATVIVDSTISDWLACGATSLDPARALAELELVLDGETTAVGLRLCHAISDAKLGFALLQDFWRIAVALSETATLPDSTPVYPHSLEDLYRERGIPLPTLNTPGSGAVHSIPASEESSGMDFRPVVERITLSSNETSELLRGARASGTTLHALLAAAIIRAERATITESSDTELPMIMFHLVDLRPHLRPPARNSDVTNALAYAPTVTACAPDSDLRVLAKEAKEQIVQGIESGTALAVMLAAAAVAAQGRTRNSVGSFITNWGIVPSLDCPHGMEIVDFRGFTTSEPVSMVGYFVYTFQGRLNIELACSDRHYRPAQIGELRGNLVACLELLLHE